MININLEDYYLVKPDSIECISDDDIYIDIQLENDNTYYIVGINDLILSHNCDGDSITALLVNFFSKWEGLYDLGIVYRVITPLLVLKKGNIKKYFYSLEDFNKWQQTNNIKNWTDVLYKKGLGSLEEDEFKDMMTNPKTLKFIKDENFKESLDTWFLKDTEKRKNKILKA